MDELHALQQWYLRQCDEDWEHSYGVKIETLDNPGWALTVDLCDTELDGVTFEEVRRGDSEEGPDWIFCKVTQDQFQGACGPLHLQELVQVFLHWAGAWPPDNAPRTPPLRAGFDPNA